MVVIARRSCSGLLVIARRQRKSASLYDGCEQGSAQPIYPSIYLIFHLIVILPIPPLIKQTSTPAKIHPPSCYEQHHRSLASRSPCSKIVIETSEGDCRTQASMRILPRPRATRRARRVDSLRSLRAPKPVHLPWTD